MRWEGGGGGVSVVVVVVMVEAEGLGRGLDGLVHFIGLHLRVRVHHEHTESNESISDHM